MDEGFVDKYDPAEFSAYQIPVLDVQVRSRLIWGSRQGATIT